jgi:hypothetical protein
LKPFTARLRSTARFISGTRSGSGSLLAAFAQRIRTSDISDQKKRQVTHLLGVAVGLVVMDQVVHKVPGRKHKQTKFRTAFQENTTHVDNIILLRNVKILRETL